MFNGETEADGVLRQKDLELEQRRIGFGHKVFGVWALMRSSRRAESREARAVERKRRSLDRQEKRLKTARHLSAATRRMLMRSSS